ncbi:MAG: class I tRNA ligase family protein, partial [Leeuwenhoekiella sp.]
GKGFINKIWNAYRLIEGWEIDENKEQHIASKIGLKWYDAKINASLSDIEDHFTKYRISDALMTTYKLIWDDFCSWLLEIVKPDYGEPIDRKTYDGIIAALENNLRILHPFIPFASEEIWHQISSRDVKDALIVNHWPGTERADANLISDFELASQIISGVRTIRKEKNISFKEQLDLFVLSNESFNPRFESIIKRLGNLSSMEKTDKSIEGALSFRVKANEYFVPLKGAIDIDAEIEKIKEELNYTEGFIKSVEKKLSNSRFVDNAPKQVVDLERQKQEDAKAKIEALQKRLNALS